MPIISHNYSPTPKYKTKPYITTTGPSRAILEGDEEAAGRGQGRHHVYPTWTILA